jgi:hypothetical protein
MWYFSPSSPEDASGTELRNFTFGVSSRRGGPLVRLHIGNATDLCDGVAAHPLMKVWSAIHEDGYAEARIGR